MGLILKITQGQRLGLIFVFLFIISMITGVLPIIINLQSQDDARDINLAGRQRMLSQKMAKEALLIVHLGENATHEITQGLTSTRREFEEAHIELKTIDETGAQWNLVDSLWQEFKTIIISVEDLTYPANIAEEISTKNVQLLIELNEFVEILEQDANQRNDQSMLTSIIATIVTSVVLVGLWFGVFLLNKKREELEEIHLQALRLQTMGELAGGIAHDFNNILAIIMNNAEFLLDTLDGDPQQSFQEKRTIIEDIIFASERAGNLIKNLVQFSRTSEISLEIVEINSIIDELVSILKHTFNKSIRCSVQNTTVMTKVKGDKSLLFNIFLNLALNASDAMPEGGHLIFKIKVVHFNELEESHISNYTKLEKQSNNYVQISVSDTGIGMDKKIMTNLFKPFYTTKTEVKIGVGLGLASVYGSVLLHNGVIHVKSRPNQGSTFIISLPLLRSN